MKFLKLLPALWISMIMHCNATDIQSLTRDQRAENIIQKSIISESDYQMRSKELFESLWKNLNKTTDDRYEFIEKSIVELLSYFDEVVEEISEKSCENFGEGIYRLLDLFYYDLTKNNVFEYFDCIRDPFIEREEARLSIECEEELERRMEEIKPLDQWKPGESIIFEVELLKKGELQK